VALLLLRAPGGLHGPAAVDHHAAHPRLRLHRAGVGIAAARVGSRALRACFKGAQYSESGQGNARI
jgi:hypothetical protein